MKRDEREKQLHNALGRLAKDVNQLKERCKVMDIKISRIQDETAKLAVQEDGVVKALDTMVDTVIKVANKHEIKHDEKSTPAPKAGEMGVM